MSPDVRKDGGGGADRRVCPPGRMFPGKDGLERKFKMKNDMMKIMNMRLLATALLLLYAACAAAQEVRDSVKIHFRQGRVDLNMSLRENRQALEGIEERLRVDFRDSIYELKRVRVIGGASPEGSIPLNRRLSERRAQVLFNYLSRYGALPDSLTVFTFLGRDWEGLIRLVEEDSLVPYRGETLELLRDIAARSRGGEDAADDNLGRLSRFKGGEPYRYMYWKLFPDLRASQVLLWYERVVNPLMLPPRAAEVIRVEAPVLALQPVCTELPPPPKPFYMAIKTNLLYDAVAIPNVGVEFYLGRDWSVDADWMYAWWKIDREHWYWRVYGGEVAVKKWFGSAAKRKPLTGHHIGVYAQMLTYDFETGGTGYMGGKPGGDLWDKANWGVGVEYGYSLPVGRRLNLDFAIGVGYLGGEYWKYKPEDDCYVWQETKDRNWFGPTKAEVSLVWLLGRGNYNKEKGGKR